MSDELRRLARRLIHGLELDRPPVQVSYLEDRPEGLARHPGGAPSVCTFFAEGQHRPFYAELSDHEACEIGAFVLGIRPEGALGDRLTTTLGRMQGEGYLAPGEEGSIAHNASPPRFVAYGPLGSLAVPPTGVLMIAKPKSVMYALETARLPTPMLGRPMCAIMPTLANGAPLAVSVGCIGSRIYTDMGDDRMVVGLRGDHLAPFVAALDRVRSANRAVGAEDARRKREAPRPYGGAGRASGSRRRSPRPKSSSRPTRARRH